MGKYYNSIEEEREALSNAIDKAQDDATKRRQEYEAQTGKKAGGHLRKLFEKQEKENFEIVIE